MCLPWRCLGSIKEGARSAFGLQDQIPVALPIVFIHVAVECLSFVDACIAHGSCVGVTKSPGKPLCIFGFVSLQGLAAVTAVHLTSSPA